MILSLTSPEDGYSLKKGFSSIRTNLDAKLRQMLLFFTSRYLNSYFTITSGLLPSIKVSVSRSLIMVDYDTIMDHLFYRKPHTRNMPPRSADDNIDPSRNSK